MGGFCPGLNSAVCAKKGAATNQIVLEVCFCFVSHRGFCLFWGFLLLCKLVISMEDLDLHLLCSMLLTEFNK